MAKGKSLAGKIVSWVLIVGFLILTTSGLWIPIGIHIFFDKAYHFTDVSIQAQVMQNGDVEFTERRTFAFKNGPFHYADYTVADPQDRVRDFSVSEVVNGQEVPIPSASGYHSIIYNDFESHFNYLSPATDEQRTFVFHYRYACAVDVFPDTASFFWQFIGTGWEVPTDHASVSVQLPGVPRGSVPPRPDFCKPDAPVPAGAKSMIATTPLPADQIRAWGHGPLNGSVAIAPGRVTFDASSIPPNSYVEGRILFPPDAVPSAPLASTDNKVPQILGIETRLTADANALRAKHDIQRHNVNILLIAVPILLALLVLLSRFRDRVPGVPRTLQEPPEPDSVEAAFVWAQFVGGSSNPGNVYRTQVLRLVSIGAVDIQAEGTVTEPKDIKLIKKKDEAELDNPVDRDFLVLLFGASTDTDSVNEVSVEHPRAARVGDVGRHVRYTRWMEDAKKNAGRAMSAIEHGDARFESVATGVITIAAGLYGFYTATFGVGGKVGWWLVPECIILGIVALKLIPARVHPDLRERIAKLAAFRRYLKKFSSLPNAPAMAVIIWEKYMEWATALGVAKQVEKQIRALVPAEQLASPWPNSQISGIAAINMWSSLNASTPSLIATSSADYHAASTSGGFGGSSSFSGGGGGFSGGGGGGGGGTGGGAG